MAGGQIDYLDMSLWDCFKPPQDPAYADRPLIEHFAALPRHGTRLGVAGKIMDAATAQRCLDAGADFVLIGRGAMLHHDFARRALADPAFRCIERPVSRAHLRSRGPGPGVPAVRDQHLAALRGRSLSAPAASAGARCGPARWATWRRACSSA